MADAKLKTQVTVIPPASQADASPSISGGHPYVPQVVNGKVINSQTASVVGQVPVFRAYKNS
jgi:hypothetical protein